MFCVASGVVPRGFKLRGRKMSDFLFIQHSIFRKDDIQQVRVARRLMGAGEEMRNLVEISLKSDEYSNVSFMGNSDEKTMELFKSVQNQLSER